MKHQFIKKIELNDEKLFLGESKSYYNIFLSFFRNKQKNKNKNLLIQHMDQFLHLNNINLIFELLNNGYILTKKQLKSFNELLIEEIYKDEDIDTMFNLIEKALSNNVSLDDDIKFLLFKKILGIDNPLKMTNNEFHKYNYLVDIPLLFKADYIVSINKNDEKIDLPLLTNLIRNYIQAGIFFKKELSILLDNIESIISCGSSTKSYLAIKYIKYFELLITGQFNEYFLPQIDYAKLNKIGKKIEKSKYCKDDLKLEMRNFLSLLLTINFKNNEHILKIETKKEFKQNYIENHATHKIIQNNIIKKELPIEAVTLLIKTEEIYFNFTEEFKEKDFECKNLFEKKIPQLIEEYLAIDTSFRNSLKHISEKNADNFLIESLNNIHNHINKKWINMNEEKLIDLSVTTRYTSNFQD